MFGESVELAEEVGRGVRSERGARGGFGRLRDTGIPGGGGGGEEGVDGRVPVAAALGQEVRVGEGPVLPPGVQQEADGALVHVPPVVVRDVGALVVEQREQDPGGGGDRIEIVVAPGTVGPLQGGEKAKGLACGLEGRQGMGADDRGLVAGPFEGPLHEFPKRVSDVAKVRRGNRRGRFWRGLRLHVVDGVVDGCLEGGQRIQRGGRRRERE